MKHLPLLTTDWFTVLVWLLRIGMVAVLFLVIRALIRVNFPRKPKA